MYIASMDIQTAFDVARPKHIANILRGQDVHGWCRASKYKFTRCITQGSVGVPTLWLKLALQMFMECRYRMDEENDKVQIIKMSRWEPSNLQLCVGRKNG